MVSKNVKRDEFRGRRVSRGLESKGTYARRGAPAEGVNLQMSGGLAMRSHSRRKLDR